MTGNKTTNLSEAIRNLIVCDTQFGWNGETTLKLPELLDLQARGWLIEGDENNEFSLTVGGEAVVARALQLAAPAELAEQQGNAPEIDQLRQLVSGILSTVSLGHQTGPYAYAGEDFGRYLSEATSDCRTILRMLNTLAATGKQQPSTFDGGGEYYADQHGDGAWATYRRDGNGWVYNFGNAEDAEVRATSVARELNRQVEALAARQPGAQEPVAVVTTSERFTYGKLNRAMQDGTQLYAAPPAQGIDLGQFRTQVAELLRMEFDLEVADPEDHRHDDGASEAERIASKIAALIDQRDAAPGVGNG